MPKSIDNKKTSMPDNLKVAKIKALVFLLIVNLIIYIFWYITKSK